MLVEIVKGDIRFTVPYKAFISKFKPCGYQIVDGFQPEVEQGKADKRVRRLQEIPVSEMTVKQLKAYAKYLGLEIDSYSGKQALRTAIMNYLVNG